MSGRVFRNIQGFSLVEMAIVLLIAGLLIAGAFQLMSNMQQGRADQATANEMRTVVTALERFLNDQQGILTLAPNPLVNPNTTVPFTQGNLQIDGIQAQTYFRDNYLPTGFNLTDYRIGIRRTADITGAGSAKPVLRGLIVRRPVSTLTETRQGRIATLVGSQGGLVRDDGSGNAQIAGVQGSWSVNPALYSFAAGSGSYAIGDIAAYTTTIDAQMNTNILSRINTGNPEANTMRTDLLMNDSNMVQSALGYSYTKMRVNTGSSCNTGVAAIELLQKNGNSFSPTRRYPQSGGTISADDQERLQGLVVSGYIDGGFTQETLLQCRRVGVNWVWQIAIPAQSGSYYNYASAGNIVATPEFNGYGGTVTGSVTGPYLLPPPDALLLFNFDGNGKPTSGASAVSSAPSRRANTWYWNNTGGPIQLSISLNDGENINSAIFIRENFSATSAGPLRNLIHATVTSDWEGDTPMTIIIPSDSIYAVVIREVARANRVTIWAEYR